MSRRWMNFPWFSSVHSCLLLWEAFFSGWIKANLCVRRWSETTKKQTEREMRDTLLWCGFHFSRHYRHHHQHRRRYLFFHIHTHSQTCRMVASIFIYTRRRRALHKEEDTMGGKSISHRDETKDAGRELIVKGSRRILHYELQKRALQYP